LETRYPFGDLLKGERVVLPNVWCGNNGPNPVLICQARELHALCLALRAVVESSEDMTVEVDHDASRVPVPDSPPDR
jgi:hypothetical protein